MLDYFAGCALTGLLTPTGGKYFEARLDCAVEAYRYADAMLKARES